MRVQTIERTSSALSVQNSERDGDGNGREDDNQLEHGVSHEVRSIGVVLESKKKQKESAD